MALSKERQGEIAAKMIQVKMEADGFHLRPQHIKREINNESRRLGVSSVEMAEFAKRSISIAYERTIAQLDSIIESGDVK